MVAISVAQGGSIQHPALAVEGTVGRTLASVPRDCHSGTYQPGSVAPSGPCFWLPAAAVF